MKFRLPLIEPAKVKLLLRTVWKVETVAELLVTTPPVFGRVLALLRLPTIWFVPFKSNVPPKLSVSVSLLLLKPDAPGPCPAFGAT